MNTLPLFFKLENRPVLVVGGGEVALRKADLLDKAGATITFVAPSYEARLIAQFSDSRHQLINDVYQQKYLDKQTIVIACTDDEMVNAQIFHDCEARFIPVNVVDIHRYVPLSFLPSLTAIRLPLRYPVQAKPLCWQDCCEPKSKQWCHRNMVNWQGWQVDFAIK